MWNICLMNEFLQGHFSCLRLIYKTVHKNDMKNEFLM